MSPRVPSDSSAPAAGVQPAETFRVASPNVVYTDEHILSTYTYRDAKVVRNVDQDGPSMTVIPTETVYEFKVDRTVPRLGLMLVGWGGNNGSTLTASIIANRRNITWRTKEGLQTPNYIGSVTQSSTLKLGLDENGNDVYIPFNQILPMVNPNDLVIGGWDINGANLADAMTRAKVLEYDLQRQVADEMKELKPLPSIYYPDYIAANQEDRADNCVPGTAKMDHVEHIRKDIREFKAQNGLDRVVVLWTANTERFSDITPGVNDTADNLLASIAASHAEIAPSTIFAVASILEGCAFVNGSPQNTFVPGAIELAERHRVHIGGDDFKSGQTKLKSVLVDFLVFRSKEISKSNVVDDMGEHPDHIVVIKYCPSVGDSKRALDEYVSEIFMGGRNTLSVYNVCEDSLLASPLILDLAILTELMTRITYKTGDMPEHSPFHSVLSILSYMLRRLSAAMENIFRACVGLPPSSDMLLEAKIW
ncbi:hypothetical protein BC829DRAFT_425907 [Chytridium lagenaria]|nr:hypothetical protein BC829DRAFT_425907 [Chytridium lagenaria]